MSDWERFEEELLQDDETRREFERLRPQYEVMTDAIRARTAAGLSQAELAQRMGKQQPAIARFEGARVQPSIAFLQQLAEALDLRLVVRLEPKNAVDSASGSEKRDNLHESTEPVRDKATA